MEAWRLKRPRINPGAHGCRLIANGHKKTVKKKVMYVTVEKKVEMFNVVFSGRQREHRLGRK